MAKSKAVAVQLKSCSEQISSLQRQLDLINQKADLINNRVGFLERLTVKTIYLMSWGAENWRVYLKVVNTGGCIHKDYGYSSQWTCALLVYRLSLGLHDEYAVCRTV